MVNGEIPKRNLHVPYYWVDDHPLLYGNNGSLDPGTYTLCIYSGQISIIPKPELRGFGGGFPYFSPPFGVTSAGNVVIMCPDM